MKTHCSTTELFTHFTANTTILTPNRRLSATLHKLYQTHVLEQQKKIWETPDILPVSTWIQRLFNDYTRTEFSVSPYLLNSTQEQYLWEKILLAANESRQLLQISETAVMVASAWGLLHQWQVDLHHPVFKSADDYAALQDWVLQFQKICQTKNWLDNASLSDVMAEKIKNQKIIPNQQIILVGFTEISPQLKQLLTTCEMNRSKILHIELTQEHNDCKRISLLDAEKEILTMARWAKAKMAKEKTAFIGCVIPSLDKIRDRVQQIFAAVFTDQTNSSESNTALFNISAGKNLLHYPLIHAALQFLALHKKNISVETFSFVLTSPFLGGAESERIKRGLFDSLLRQANIKTIDLNSLFQKTEATKIFSLEKNCPQLAKRLQEFFLFIEENNQAHAYQEWATIFTQVLTLLGWPGERSLNSEEYQIVECWLKLLTDYATLDHIAQPVNFQQALQMLHKLASRTSFQPKTPAAPIQVLGVLEAAALPFDYLWVAGMDDLSWPPQPKPNPFIPKQLQRELVMPHATAERELMFCNSLIQQFKQSAKKVIFSHAEHNDELELQCTSLIRDLPKIELDDLYLDAYQTPAEHIYAAKKIECLVDEVAPIVMPDEKIRGGVNVLKLQALCPFKAFAEWRLHAHALEVPLPGLRATDRGKITHKILEMVWGELQTHSTLVNMSEIRLTEIIHASIDVALKDVSQTRTGYTQYLMLEKKRLHKLIWDWLEIEKQRPPFIVINNEKATQITLNQLNLSIRIDRIDQLADGKKLIIDYKTGKNNEINNWFGDRPEEPQLPLYALLDSENNIGVTFAQIAPGENCFKGISRYALEIKGIKLIPEIKKSTAMSWDEQLAQWQEVLHTLSDAFYHGKATVDPKHPQQTCTWCALKPLCRIHEEQREC